MLETTYIFKNYSIKLVFNIDFCYSDFLKKSEFLRNLIEFVWSYKNIQLKKKKKNIY